LGSLEFTARQLQLLRIPNTPPWKVAMKARLNVGLYLTGFSKRKVEDVYRKR